MGNTHAGAECVRALAQNGFRSLSICDLPEDQGSSSMGVGRSFKRLESSTYLDSVAKFAPHMEINSFGLDELTPDLLAKFDVCCWFGEGPLLDETSRSVAHKFLCARSSCQVRRFFVCDVLCDAILLGYYEHQNEWAEKWLPHIRTSSTDWKVICEPQHRLGHLIYIAHSILKKRAVPSDSVAKPRIDSAIEDARSQLFVNGLKFDEPELRFARDQICGAKVTASTFNSIIAGAFVAKFVYDILPQDVQVELAAAAVPSEEKPNASSTRRELCAAVPAHPPAHPSRHPPAHSLAHPSRPPPAIPSGVYNTGPRQASVRTPSSASAASVSSGSSSRDSTALTPRGLGLRNLGTT